MHGYRRTAPFDHQARRRCSVPPRVAIKADNLIAKA
jgi:hypothetical protein